MRILAFMRKTLLENLREWKILILTLVFAPAFVYMMWGYFHAATPAYSLLVVNHDTRGESESSVPNEVRGLIATWEDAAHPDGRPVFDVTEVAGLPEALATIRNHNADLVVEIPAGFSQTLADFREDKSEAPASLINHADEKSVRSSMAMALSDYTAYTYASQLTAAATPLDVSLQSLGSSRSLNEFDLYVPALLVLAIIMVLFTAATSLIKEVDQGTVTRLMLSKLRTTEFLTAVTINQVFIGVTALALAYLAALSCGYRSDGSMAMVLLIGAATTLGVVAIAVLTAAFLRSMFELLTVGTFPFFILMFFSEAMFPLPRIRVWEIGNNVLYANDVLPPTLGVRALNKVLNYGGGFEDIAFELSAVLILSAVYFVLGAWLFRRRHLRT